MTAKNSIIVVFSLLLFILLSGTGYGHQQAVVIPLNSSRTAVAGYDQGDLNEPLGAIDEVVRTVTLDLPNNGLVIVNISGYWTWSGATDRRSAVRCSITQGNTVDFNSLIIAGSDISDMVADYVPFAGTRAFPLEKGTQTFNFVCDTFGAVDDELIASDVNMNAVYHYAPNISIP